MAGGNEITELRALVDEQRRALELQATTIAALTARLDAVDGGVETADRTPLPAVTAAADRLSGASALPTERDGGSEHVRTDRRGLLRSVGVAAAGVATGAVVLGQASPAAAAQGVFDGNPGVVSLANPDSGIGVQGSTLTGTGVYGRAFGTVGPSIGVEGRVSGSVSTGVKGYATNASSATIGVLGQVLSPQGIAVKGVSAATSGTTSGVRGEAMSASGYGVSGVNTATTGNAYGVYGTTSSSSGSGVKGDAPSPTGSGIGVAGTSSGSSGIGVLGAGAIGVNAITGVGIALVASSPKSQVRLAGGGQAPPIAGLPRLSGEIAFDVNEDLWLCIADGTPGTWRRLGGASTAGALVLLSVPVRVYDSRTGFVPATGPKSKIANAETRVLDTKNNSSGVPAGATGVLATLTVVNGSANGGFLTMFAAGKPTPQTSTVNWSGGGAVAATTVSAVNASANVAIYCAPNSSTDLILDIIGYYR